MLHGPAVSTELAKVLVEARKRLDLTQQQVAEAVGVSRPAVGQWESGSKEPSTGNLMKVADFLRIDFSAALQGKLREDSRSPENKPSYYIADDLMDRPLPKRTEDEFEPFDVGGSPATVRIAPTAPTGALQAQYAFPLDVPVLGVTVGGADHDFQFNGETVDFVRRPPGIASAKKAYATFVVGDSMYPAHSEGALVYVNPDKPPSIGDDVIIEVIHEETRGDVTGELPGRAYIKRLVKRTPTKIVVMQFNPPEEIEFDRTEVKVMHRVIPWNELLGI